MNIFKRIFSKLNKKRMKKTDFEFSNTLEIINDDRMCISDYKSIVLDEEPNMVKAVFLYLYNNMPIQDEYQAYFKYKYFIKNTKNLHMEFIKQGFLIELDIENNIHIVLNMMTIVELKELLKIKGLKVSGKKADLVERLLAININKNEISKKYPVYTLSEKAKKYLEKYDYLYKLHQSTYNIELEEYIYNKNELEKTWKINKVRFNDVLWTIFNKRILKYSANGDYGFLSNNFLNMYELTKSEGKTNLQLLCNALYIDLSGMGNNNTVDNINIMLYPIAPGISKELKKYKLEDLIKSFKKVQIKLPFTYFNLNQMINIVIDDYTDSIHDIEKLKNISNKPNKKSSKYQYFDTDTDIN